MTMFGESVVERLSAKLLLPDEVVERLVACSPGFQDHNSFRHNERNGVDQ